MVFIPEHKLLWLVAIFMLFLSCEEKKVNNPLQNLPPETDVFVSSQDTLNYTRSTQHIFWDGRDPDGFVTGFYYTWIVNPQPSDWTFTTDRSKVFPLKITGVDTIYLFQVKAVDDEGLEDPTPARQNFPIRNSAPELKWTLASLIPDTTFTVATFIWDVFDLDGDSTIDYFEYTLDDDTLNWNIIPGYLRSLTLNADSGLTEGEHSFTIRAVDIAGAKSETLRMPENPGATWYVKEPRGRYLLIDDFENESTTVGFPDAYYKGMMERVMVPRGENYSYWNIEDLFPASNEQFTQTMNLFDYVIWYTDISRETDDHFITAQVAVPKFLNRAPREGGKIIYSTMFDQNFGVLGSPLAFTPVSSLSSEDYRCFPGNIYNPDTLFYTAFPNIATLPILKVSEFFVGIKALIPKTTAVPIYRFQNPSPPNDTPLFIIVGRNDNSGLYDFVFSATPLHQLKANNNLDDFFDIILNEIF
ncbi:MAG: hypothetical protein JSW33_10360 [bacterium]|nr:MAG: hypothetical protein JSW33_10360 [bacterium]